MPFWCLPFLHVRTQIDAFDVSDGGAKWGIEYRKIGNGKRMTKFLAPFQLLPAIILVAATIGISSSAHAECFAASNPFDPERAKALTPSLEYMKSPVVKTYVDANSMTNKAVDYYNKAGHVCTVLETAHTCASSGEDFETCSQEVGKSALCEGSKLLGLSANPFSNLANSPARGAAKPMAAMIDAIVPLSNFNPFCEEFSPEISGLYCCTHPTPGEHACIPKTEAYGLDEFNNQVLLSGQELCTRGQPSASYYVGRAGTQACRQYPACNAPDEYPTSGQGKSEAINAHFEGISNEIRDMLGHVVLKTGLDGDNRVAGTCSVDEFYDLLTWRGCNNAVYGTPISSENVETASDLINQATLRLMASIPQGDRLWTKPARLHNSADDELFYSQFVDDCGKEIFKAYGWDNLPDFEQIYGLTIGMGSSTVNACEMADEFNINATTFKSPGQGGVQISSSATNSFPGLAYADLGNGEIQSVTLDSDTQNSRLSRLLPHPQIVNTNVVMLDHAGRVETKSVAISSEPGLISDRNIPDVANPTLGTGGGNVSEPGFRSQRNTPLTPESNPVGLDQGDGAAQSITDTNRPERTRQRTRQQTETQSNKADGGLAEFLKRCMSQGLEPAACADRNSERFKQACQIAGAKNRKDCIRMAREIKD